MSAIEILIDEHGLISRMVNILAALQKDLERGGQTNVDALNNVVDFFRVFVDENHHAKEERALFPVLERKGVSIEGCTIHNLTREHERGREIMRTLAAALVEYRDGDSMASTKISTALRSTVDLYKDHIWRENILLFPAGEKALQKSEQSDVTKAFGVIDERFGTAFRAKYEGLVDSLDKTAASRLT